MEKKGKNENGSKLVKTGNKQCIWMEKILEHARNIFFYLRLLHFLNFSSDCTLHVREQRMKISR